eukprot:gene14845-16510_t
MLAAAVDESLLDSRSWKVFKASSYELKEESLIRQRLRQRKACQRISTNCLIGFRVLLDCLTGASESKHKRKRKHDSSDGDEAEEIQVEEKRSHGDGKAAEKTENKGGRKQKKEKPKT